ncbi:MAG: hypothetical protein WCN87_04985, partial [Chlamydiota bacterium]
LIHKGKESLLKELQEKLESSEVAEKNLAGILDGPKKGQRANSKEANPALLQEALPHLDKVLKSESDCKLLATLHSEITGKKDLKDLLSQIRESVVLEKAVLENPTTIPDAEREVEETSGKITPLRRAFEESTERLGQQVRKVEELAGKDGALKAAVEDKKRLSEAAAEAANTAVAETDLIKFKRDMGDKLKEAEYFDLETRMSTKGKSQVLEKRVECRKEFINTIIEKMGVAEKTELHFREALAKALKGYMVKTLKIQDVFPKHVGSGEKDAKEAFADKIILAMQQKNPPEELSEANFRKVMAEEKSR